MGKKFRGAAPTVRDGVAIFSRHEKPIIHVEDYDKYLIHIVSDILKKDQSTVYSAILQKKSSGRTARGAHMKSSIYAAVSSAKELCDKFDNGSLEKPNGYPARTPHTICYPITALLWTFFGAHIERVKEWAKHIFHFNGDEPK